MKKYIAILMILFMAIPMQTVPAFAAFKNSYAYYGGLAQDSLLNSRRDEAFFYIEAAHLSFPSRTAPFRLLESITFSEDHKRLYPGYVMQATEALKRSEFHKAKFYFQVASQIEPKKSDIYRYMNQIDEFIDGQGGSEKKLLDRIYKEQKEVLNLAVLTRQIDGYKPQEREKFRKFMKPVMKLDERIESDIFVFEVDHQGELKEESVERMLDDYEKKDTQARVEKISSNFSYLDMEYETQKRLRNAVNVIPVSKQMIVKKTTRKKEDLQPDVKNIKGQTTSSPIRKQEVYNQKRRDIVKQRRAEIRPRGEKVLEAKNEFKSLIKLDDALWAKQPGTTIEIEFDRSVIFEGVNIKRYLAVDEGFLEVERLTKDRIKVTSIRRGASLFHVWDDRGRWTFNIKGILPELSEASLIKSREELWEEYVEPFKLSYSNNWDAFYIGNNVDNLKRQNLTFTQYLGIDGPTPYGEFDASVNFFKFDQSTERTGQRIGLTNETFTIRGWDTSKYFSDFSLPGRFFRGGLIDAYVLNRKLKLTYLQGEDRANFLVISGAIAEVRKSYIEGARMTLFPDTEHQYSLNWATGHGEERSDDLKEKVFSFDTEHKFGPLKLDAEWGYDEQDFAKIINTKYEADEYALRVSARDIERGYRTITTRPSDVGEVGGTVDFDWRPDNFKFNANLDLYRDRENSNPLDPDAVNMDLGLSLNVPLSKTLYWNTSAFYVNTPQIISPRRSVNVSSTLSKSFKALNDRIISTFVTGSFQRNRYSFTPGSEYDRYSVRAGFRMPIVKNLTYYLNYDYGIVNVQDNGEQNSPRVLNTGLSYNKTFRDNITTRFSLSYRDEEEADGRFSFLSGTDQIRGSIGVSYYPVPDTEIFFDGSMRNVLAENNSSVAFNDASVRFGVRTTWETFFAWNPSSVISGVVFKDDNRNGIQDVNEYGIEDVQVKVGKNIVTTNKYGKYKQKVRAKKVKVAIQLDSTPQGASFSNDLEKEIQITHKRPEFVHFGLSFQSGIYGVVFEDLNGNGQFEINEPTIPKVKITLDGKDNLYSDFEGIYNFYDADPGKHTLTIDINSIPLQYLPSIKLKNEIEIFEGSTYKFHIPLKQKNN